MWQECRGAHIFVFDCMVHLNWNVHVTAPVWSDCVCVLCCVSYCIYPCGFLCQMSWLQCLTRSAAPGPGAPQEIYPPPLPLQAWLSLSSTLPEPVPFLFICSMFCFTLTTQHLMLHNFSTSTPQLLMLLTNTTHKFLFLSWPMSRIMTDSRSILNNLNTVR